VPRIHHLLGPAGGDVPGGEVPEGGVDPLQVVVPLRVGDLVGGPVSPSFFGTQIRPSFRRDSLMRVSLDWYSPLWGMQVGWIWVKQGLAKPAPFFVARQAAVTLHPLALVERKKTLE
jgi:hypothetical protein